MEAWITGVGMTPLEKRAQAGPVGLAARALAGALEDSGLEHSDVDGLIVHIGSPRGQDYDRLAESLGLEVTFASQTWSHGRFMSTVITHAALAVAHGLAENVVCLAAYKNSGFARIGEPGSPLFQEVAREGGGPHGEQSSIGFVAPSGGAALAWSRYQALYAPPEGCLEKVALGQRRSAQANPLAALRAPLTGADYRGSPRTVAPLRRLDSSFPVDGGACVIVSKTPGPIGSRAVKIAGTQGLRGGREMYVFGPTGLGLWNQSEIRPTLAQATSQRAYEMADVSVSDIDVFYTYDAFTPLVLFALEEYGLTPPGEAADFVDSGGLVRGERPWVNTNGGLLSEGHLNGWGHVHEMVMQLRGEAGQRQVENAKVAVWGALAGDGLVLVGGEG